MPSIFASYSWRFFFCSLLSRNPLITRFFSFSCHPCERNWRHTWNDTVNARWCHWRPVTGAEFSVHTFRWKSLGGKRSDFTFLHACMAAAAKMNATPFELDRCWKGCNGYGRGVTWKTMFVKLNGKSSWGRIGFWDGCIKQKLKWGRLN